MLSSLWHANSAFCYKCKRICTLFGLCSALWWTSSTLSSCGFLLHENAAWSRSPERRAPSFWRLECCRIGQHGGCYNPSTVKHLLTCVSLLLFRLCWTTQLCIASPLTDYMWKIQRLHRSTIWFVEVVFLVSDKIFVTKHWIHWAVVVFLSFVIHIFHPS